MSQIVGVGDVDGDGICDLIWRNTQSGDVAVWFISGFGLSHTPLLASHVPLAWQIVGVRDVDGDGNADLIWRNTQTGDVAVWLLSGGVVKQSSGTAWAITDDCLTTPPLSNQTATSPVCVLRQMRSAFPSPSTSRTPTICHASGTCEASSGVCDNPNPEINQTATSPDWVFRQIKSHIPSPSTSPTPTIWDMEPGDGPENPTLPV